ncbi:hypothetical protein [Tenacibaculum maritimum]|uniref:hypothetical protein n=1 Tax=Tenacibaculum maritimum TaxID=107401 RepID=UPI0023074FED|nr:hypothetical protein [Tenacibaculum maritimum]MDB0601471.1 hypothetical protein [Tenacibaculum maritimum]MDB0612985.1 hypothetical protein [Tenacibaculum maritimum]
MATKDTVKQWFKTKLEPTQTQFWSFFDSIRWNSETIPVSDVQGLDKILIAKADKQAFNIHLNDTNKHVSSVEKKAWNNKLDTGSYEGTAEDLKQDIYSTNIDLTQHKNDTNVHITATEKNNLHFLDDVVFDYSLPVIMAIENDFSDVGSSGKTFAEFAFAIAQNGKKYLLKRSQTVYDFRNCMLRLKPFRSTNQPSSPNLTYYIRVSGQEFKINENYSYYEIEQQNLSAYFPLSNGDVFKYAFRRFKIANSIQSNAISLTATAAKKVTLPLNVRLQGIVILGTSQTTIEVSKTDDFTANDYVGEITGVKNDILILPWLSVSEIWLKSTENTSIQLIYNNL